MSHASSYYEEYWSTGGYCAHRLFDPYLLRFYTRYLKAGDRMLDFGCGDGASIGHWFADLTGSYVGVDVSGQAVDAARARGLDARRVEPDEPLPFDPSSLDVVVASEVLEHLFDPAQRVGEFFRILRPGGLLIVTVPNVAYFRRTLELARGVWNPFGDLESIERPWRDPHIRFFTTSALTRMLTEAGFDLLEIDGHEGEVNSAWRLSGVARAFPSVRGAFADALHRRLAPLLAGRLHAAARRPS